MGTSRSLPTFLFCLETWGDAYAHELRWSSWEPDGCNCMDYLMLNPYVHDGTQDGG